MEADPLQDCSFACSALVRHQTALGPLVSKGYLKLLLALELENRNRENPRKIQGWREGPVLGGTEDSTWAAVWPCICQGGRALMRARAWACASAGVLFAGETAAWVLSFLDAASVR